MPKKKITKVTRKAEKSSSNKNALIAVIGIIFLIAVAVALSGFLFSTAPGQETIPRDQYDNYYQPPAGTPILTMIRPLSGEVIRSSTIGIRVNVTSFQLVDITANRPNVENQGHLTYLLDGSEIKKTVYKADSIANVPAGTHTVTVELRNNDNTPLSPPVSVSVTVTTE
jgi:FlaG/FlaF family flagellin (archaellin)